MTTYQQGLIDGAKMGAGQVGTALFMMGTSMLGTSTEIAAAMREKREATIGRVAILHERGFLQIAEWLMTKNGYQPRYLWNPGAPDTPKPRGKRERLADQAAENEANRQAGQKATLEDVARRATKHGHEEINGAVRVHRMRG